MVVSLKHKFQSAKTDGADTSLVRPSNWNDDHDLTLDASKLVGRATASNGAAEEITVGTSLSLDAATQTLRRAALTGDVTASVDSNTTTIANNAVTTAKIANGAATLAKLDTTGTSGHVLTAQGAGVAPVWAAASGGALTDVVETIFEASGTYTPNANGKFYEVVVIAGGGGSNGASANQNLVWGSAGSGGGSAVVEFSKAQMGNTAVTVTVGAGGNEGGGGGLSSFGNRIVANGGSATSATVGTVTVNSGTANASRSGNTGNNTNRTGGFALRPYSMPVRTQHATGANVTNGYQAFAPGAGAGPGATIGTVNNSNSATGGVGGPGLVIVREYI